ncbi:unnamed protein product [Paramecium primaurelia]|uniref:HMG box domain-containing protein n=1 Tax=Paramecium primaurelia TaxID=5886 RepID=A0A8S1PNJ5_PARPR|nr:unnamed protein product [Paramecium primaurelia]
MQLRSGNFNQPPKRQYISPYQIFYQEQLKILLSQGIDINQVSCQIQQAWSDMSSQLHQYYEDQFQQCEEKFQEQLIYFYGGNHQHINQLNELKNIPSKPIRPLTPQFEYIMNNRYKFSSKNINWKQSFSLLMIEYYKQSQNVREQLEFDFERKMKDYQEEIEKWNDKYAEKYKSLKNNTIEIYKKQKTENDFEDQELNISRPIRKLIINKKEQYTQTNSGFKNVKKNHMNVEDFGLSVIYTNIMQMAMKYQQFRQKQTKKARKF